MEPMTRYTIGKTEIMESVLLMRPVSRALTSQQSVFFFKYSFYQSFHSLSLEKSSFRTHPEVHFC